MRQIRVGVVGCGVIGRVHMKAVTECRQAALAAVADVREEAASAAAREFGAARNYGSAEALLADADVEAVILALPTNVRTPLALAALAAGKHTLIEKPIAMNAGDVRRLLAARKDRVVACCSARLSLLPSTLAAARFIAGGALGALRVVRIRALSPVGRKPEKAPPPWRLNRALNGGGILMNWGCYDLDFALSLTGWRLRPRVVLAQAWRVASELREYVAPGSDAETHFAALIRCAEGEVISFERGEYVTAAADSAWQVLGDSGSLRMPLTPCKGKEVWHDSLGPDGVRTETIWTGDEEGRMQHQAVVDDFVAAVAEGRAPHTTLERALQVQEISDAIYASAASGRAVEMASS